MCMAPAPAKLHVPIVCRITPWYFKRRAMMASIFAFFGAYFLYDGSIGYPKQVEMAKKKEWFHGEFLATFDEARKKGTLDQWIAEQKAKELPTGADSEPPKWVTYAAANGWPEDPKPYTEQEIAEQFYFGYSCLAAALTVGFIVLRRKDTVLRGELDHFVTPKGLKVLFADIFRVDKRKWDRQGLAYVWFKNDNSGRSKKAVIDDLMYDGAGKVLERILSCFDGELIEKISDLEAQTTHEAPTETPRDKAGTSP